LELRREDTTSLLLTLRYYLSRVNYVDLLTAVVAKSHLFNYQGSLTTPPCSEIVNWWVINNPLHITMAEYERLAEKYMERPATNRGRDNRPTQPLNGRKVLYY
jgi:carbonic anhydrase